MGREVIVTITSLKLHFGNSEKFLWRTRGETTKANLGNNYWRSSYVLFYTGSVFLTSGVEQNKLQP
jgi:hypothetical protein